MRRLGWGGEIARRLALALLALMPLYAIGNTAAVFGPAVRDGTSAVDYRGSYAPDDGDAPGRFSQRFHYQYAFDDSWRGRLLVSQSGTELEDLQTRFLRAELQWQLLEATDAGWDSALRFELQAADDADGANQGRIAWTGRVVPSGAWELRSNVLVGREFGSNADGGLLLETRFQVSHPLAFGRLGLQLFNGLGSTEDFGGWDDQAHQLGPIFEMRPGGGWALDAGVLFGISDSADDQTWRMMIARSF